ncbi:hypothetical protein ACS0TY_024376 [Phlomoides rotata]
MAVGMESSWYRFLWSVQNPSGKQSSSAANEPDLDELLPEGFLEKTKDRIYVEQRMNRVFMVEEMKVVLPLDEAVDGFVTAAELD